MSTLFVDVHEWVSFANWAEMWNGNLCLERYVFKLLIKLAELITDKERTNGHGECLCGEYFLV